MAERLDEVVVIDVEATCWSGPPPAGQTQDIIEVGLCTASRPDLFPSYRRDGPGTGRLLTGVVRLA